MKCPECRAEHRIPYNGVQAFPTNVTLQRFLELHIEITGELPDPTSGNLYFIYDKSVHTLTCFIHSFIENAFDLCLRSEFLKIIINICLKLIGFFFLFPMNYCTTGQIMERCSVCSEKSYLSYCAHCEKKICEDCKSAHMDILRREITRFNSQVRK